MMNRRRRRILVCLVLCVGALGAGCATTTAPERKSADERAELHAQLAANYMRRNQNDVAAAELNEALEISSRNPTANYVMALLKTRLREFDEAERYFKRALDANANFSEARHYYAVFLCSRGRYKEALENFERVLRDPLYNGSVLANASAGECVADDPQGNPAQAEQYLQRALAAEPTLPNALRSMARVRYETGNYLSARAFMERYLDAAPATPQTLLLAVRIELALGAKHEAAEYAARMRRAFPRAAETAELAKIMPGGQAK